MPTLNEYKNKPGYHIKARPPNAGNITYQIEKEGYSFIEEIGLHNKEEISWEEINVLKTFGFIFTDKSGTLGPDDGFQPDPEEAKKWALTEVEARELLRKIEDLRDLTPEQREEICLVLGIEYEGGEYEQPVSDLQMLMDAVVENEHFPVDYTLDSPREDIKATVSVLSVENNDFGGFTVKLHEGEVSHLYPAVAHHVRISPGNGIQWWKIGVADGEITWSKRSELMVQQSDILLMVHTALADSDLKLGPPDQSFATDVGSVQSMMLATFMESATAVE